MPSLTPGYLVAMTVHMQQSCSVFAGMFNLILTGRPDWRMWGHLRDKLQAPHNGICFELILQDFFLQLWQVDTEPACFALCLACNISNLSSLLELSVPRTSWLRVEAKIILLEKKKKFSRQKVCNWGGISIQARTSKIALDIKFCAEICWNMLRWYSFGQSYVIQQ